MPLSERSFNNHILVNLSKSDLALLLPHLDNVDLKQKEILCDFGRKFEFIYFIEQGAASIINTMEDGASIEVGMVGYEGIVSVTALLGEKIAEQHIVMQLPGSAMRIRLDHCQAAFEQSVSLRKAVLNFMNLFLQLSAQTTACNRLHSVEQRLARWLLMSSDRFQSLVLPLTQEYISKMLGVRRVGVTETAGELQRAGLIRYVHGHITITDRAGLEKVACECYGKDYTRFNAFIHADVR